MEVSVWSWYPHVTCLYSVHCFVSWWPPILDVSTLYDYEQRMIIQPYADGLIAGSLILHLCARRLAKLTILYMHLIGSQSVVHNIVIFKHKLLNTAFHWYA